MVWLSHAANEIFNGPALLRAERLFGWSVDRERAAAVAMRILPARGVLRKRFRSSTESTC